MIYQYGLKRLRLRVNKEKLPEVNWQALVYAQMDLSPYLRPFSRPVAANHDFWLSVKAEGPSGAWAEIFAVDYYAEP